MSLAARADSSEGVLGGGVNCVAVCVGLAGVYGAVSAGAGSAARNGFAFAMGLEIGTSLTSSGIPA